MKVIILLTGLVTLLAATGCEETHGHHRGEGHGGAYQGYPEQPGYGHGEYRGYPEQPGYNHGQYQGYPNYGGYPDAR